MMRPFNITYLLLLLFLFCFIFALMWMWSEQPGSQDLQSSVPAQSLNTSSENTQLPSTDCVIFDTAPINRPRAQQILLDASEQKLQQVQQQADAIIADTERLIERHGLDQGTLSEAQKQDLKRRHNELKQRLDVLKNEG